MFTLATSLMVKSMDKVAKSSDVAMFMLGNGKMAEARDKAAINSHQVGFTRVKYGIVKRMVLVN